MKSLLYKNSQEEMNQTINILDAFSDYIDSIYFPGASEVLDPDLLTFEFSKFRCEVSA
jgi:hypothetical protein